MAKFLSMGNYTNQGLKGVLKEGGSARKKAIEDAVHAMGGRVEAFYFAFGDFDAVTITELPDNVSAAALSIGIAAAGVATVKTVVLLTPDEVDQATKKTLSYRPPAQ